MSWPKCGFCAIGDLLSPTSLKTLRCNSCLRSRKNKWRKDNPWYTSLEKARQRCTNKNHAKYPSYGGLGIRCMLTVKEARLLWVRDGGRLLTRPSIDRIDSRGHYSMKNCRFIELRENSSRGAIAKWRKFHEEGRRHTPEENLKRSITMRAVWKKRKALSRPCNRFEDGCED